MLLRVNNLSKAFGDKPVLNEFSMELGENERACILGPSGGGKTTLLNIIAGLLAPDSGKIELSDRRISYIFQEDRLLPWLTAEENITAAAGCSKALARELLDEMELNGEYKTYPDELSGGMKQRINIARALAFDSSFILMDEPFKGLDPVLRERVIERVSDRCTNRAILLVTHDRMECDKMKCSRIYEI